jgi:hypothetical protein
MAIRESVRGAASWNLLERVEVGNPGKYSPEVRIRARLGGSVLEDKSGLVGALSAAIDSFGREQMAAEGTLVDVEDRTLAVSSLEGLEGQHSPGSGKLVELELSVQIRFGMVGID